MNKIFIILISIIGVLFGNAWLQKNEKDLTKGMEDFGAILIIVISMIMFLFGLFTV